MFRSRLLSPFEESNVTMRFVSVLGGRTGRQYGTVFAVAAVTGAVLGGTVSFITESNSVAALPYTRV